MKDKIKATPDASIHEVTVLKMGIILFYEKCNSIKDMGNFLLQTNADKMCDGGF